jgi:hypothetical protein
MARLYTKKKQYDALMRNVPAWTHHNYQYWYPDWKMMRDTFLGEREIKNEGPLYLPIMEAMQDDEYHAYKERATFYNAVNRTVGALHGTIFRRRMRVTGVPKKYEDRIKQFTRTGMNMHMFAKVVAIDVLLMGRYGALLDMGKSGGDPYVVPYSAENIMDWELGIVDERIVLTRLTLRELHTTTQQNGPNTIVKDYAAYRVLELKRGKYVQSYYKRNDANAEPGKESDLAEGYPVTPKRLGKALDFIPFTFFGSMTNEANIERPPLLDVGYLNISHYRSYADLEHGRFYTGFPIYYAQSSSGEAGDFEIGPSRVWVVQQGDKPGILEFNGQGLKFLTEALDQKEQQISSLGGRMLGIRAGGTSESDNQVRLKERNEQSLLLNISSAMDESMTKLVNWWIWWAGETNPKAEVELNKDFLLENIGARELRAIHSMYLDGLLPIDVLYEYLRKSEVIPDYMDLDEFKKLLDNMEQFPNQPDAEARKEGFPDKKTQLEKEQAEDEAVAAQEALEKQQAANGNGSGVVLPGQQGNQA